jgi:hypothetical protein
MQSSARDVTFTKMLPLPLGYAVRKSNYGDRRRGVKYGADYVL